MSLPGFPSALRFDVKDIARLPDHDGGVPVRGGAP
jgi:hypothetical protein